MQARTEFWPWLVILASKSWTWLVLKTVKAIYCSVVYSAQLECTMSVNK